jgi:Coenzyme PQQ synthesis protein D (PqqD)
MVFRGFRANSAIDRTFANKLWRRWLPQDASGRLPEQANNQEAAFMKPLTDSIRRVSSPDGAIVMDLGRGTMFRVNPLGARIIDLLDSEDSPRQIASRISAEFGVPLDVVEADVAEFLDALAAHGVLDPRWSTT